MSVSKFKENLLILQLRKKDPEALGRVYDLYATSLYRFIYLKVPTAQDAEDITSELFLRFWNFVITTEDEITSIRGLLYRIGRNLVIDFYRRRAYVGSLPDETLEQIPDDRQQN